MVSEYEKLVISEAYEQIGLKKGREEGVAQGKMEVARQMKKMGLSIAQIAQATGLPEDVVEGLYWKMPLFCNYLIMNKK